MAKKKNRKKIKKRKLKVKRFVVFLIILFLLVVLFYKIFTVNITNIYIKGNDYLTDQEIIDISKISDYPKSIKNLSYTIKNRLEKNIYILSAKVYKRGFFNRVYIEIEENYPLFFYQVENKTVLYNDKEVSDKLSVPVVINKVPDTVYEKFKEKIKKIDKNILNRISEIEYKPNEVDQERFFLLMNDGNYVYITLKKFSTLNKYLDVIKSFDNKLGILYLDSGEYFDIFD